MNRPQSPSPERQRTPGQRLVSCLAGLVVLASSWIVIADDNPDAAAVTNPYLGQTEAIKAGERIYRRTCVGCHRSRGGHGPNLFGIRERMSDEQFLTTVMNGRPGTNMPPWRDYLSRKEIWQVHAFVNSRDHL